MSLLNTRDAVTVVSDKLSQGLCIPFVGNRIPFTGVSDGYHNRPSIETIMEDLVNSRTWITKDMSFLDALDMKYKSEGAQGLLGLLNQYYSAQSEPLPIHTEVAKLPATAIITTNWEISLEKALQEERKIYHVVAEDTDTPLLRSGSIPIIKLYGTLERKDTILRAFNDRISLLSTRPIITGLIQTLCAQGSLLFIGYHLEDFDFKEIYSSIKREFRDFTPTAYFVQLNPPENAVKFWSNQNQQIHIIDADPTDFLQRLNARIVVRAQSSFANATDIEEFMSDPFLRQFIGTGTLPTESQVIDNLLKQLVLLLNSSYSLEEVKLRAENAIATLVNFRPHYQALRDLQQDLLPYWFPPVIKSKDESRNEIYKILNERQAGKERIGQKGASQIKPEDRILIYSQSTRVIEVLEHWGRTDRSRKYIEVVVAECRPKSPKSFQDALAYVESIKSSNKLKFSIIPDMVIGHLFSQKKIDKIFMGAHNMALHPDGHTSITNTTGTDVILSLANQNDIPCYIFAEEAKFCSLKELEKISQEHKSAPEEILIDERSLVFRDLARTRNLIYFNPGYDKVSSKDTPFILVTEKQTLDFFNSSD